MYFAFVLPQSSQLCTQQNILTYFLFFFLAFCLCLRVSIVRQEARVERGVTTRVPWPGIELWTLQSYGMCLYHQATLLTQYFCKMPVISHVQLPLAILLLVESGREQTAKPVNLIISKPNMALNATTTIMNTSQCPLICGACLFYSDAVNE